MTAALLKRIVIAVFFVTATAASVAYTSLQPAVEPSVEIVAAVAAPGSPEIGPSRPATNHTAADQAGGDLSDLPAWRWAKPLGPPSLGLRGLLDSAGSVIFTTLSTAIFAIASLIWWALREVTRIGLTSNMVGAAAHQINETFAAIGSNFGLGSVNDQGQSYGLALILLVAVPLFVIIARFAIRRQTESMVRTLVWFIVPIAFLQVMLSGAVGSTSPPPSDTPVVATSDTVATGSPAWVALLGVEFVDDVSGLVNNIDLPDSDAVIWDTEPDPACGDYVSALYNRYLENSGDPENAGDPDLAGVSKLWEAGFASNYFTAQFGTDFGGRIGCYYLEKGNRITPDEMYAVAIAAGFGDIPGMGKGPFTIREGAKYTTADMYAFAACQWNGSSWSVTPGFDKLEGSAGHGIVERGATGGVGNVDPRDVSPEACGIWWSSQGVDGERRLYHPGGGDAGSEGVLLEWSSARQLDGLRVTSDDTPAQATGKQAARDSIEAFWGFNGFDRVLRSVVALFIALLYLWGLGGLAIGALLAQLGLVLLLVLSPLTLVLLAVPNKNGGRNQLGVRLGKMTIGFLASKLVLAVVIALTVRAILLLDGAIRAWAPGLDWFGALLAPAAALLLMRKILKAAGMGDMLKLSGSVGMTAAVAAGSDRGAGQALKTGALRDQVARSKIGKPALNRLDRASDAVTSGYKSALKGTIASPYKVARSAATKTADAVRTSREQPMPTPLTVSGDGATPMLAGFAGRLPTAGTLEGLSRSDQLNKVDKSVRDLAGIGAIDTLSGPGRVKAIAGRDADKLRGLAVESRKGIEAVDDKKQSAEQLRERQEAMRASLLETASYRTGLQPDHIKNGMQKDHEAMEQVASYGIDGWVVSNELYAPVPAAGHLSPESVASMSVDQKRNYLAQHPSLVYDTQIRERFKGESDTDYVRRITHLEIEMGHRSATGAPVDLVQTLNLSDAAIDEILLGELQVSADHRPSTRLNQKVRSELRRVAQERAATVNDALRTAERMLETETADLVALYSDQAVAFDAATAKAVAALARVGQTQAEIDGCASLDRDDPETVARLERLNADFEAQQDELRVAAEQARKTAAALSDTANTVAVTRITEALVGIEARSATTVAYEAHADLLAQQQVEAQLTSSIDTLLSVEALAAAATEEGLEEYRQRLTESTGRIVASHLDEVKAVSKRRSDGVEKQRKQRKKTGQDYVLDGPGAFA